MIVSIDLADGMASLAGVQHGYVITTTAFLTMPLSDISDDYCDYISTPAAVVVISVSLLNPACP